MPKRLSGSLLIAFATGLISACGVRANNDEQAIALQAIKAAESDNSQTLASLTKGAEMPPSFQTLPHITLKDILAPSGCSVDRIGGGREDPVVWVEWACDHIQGNQVNFTFRDGHITEIWWAPGE